MTIQRSFIAFVVCCSMSLGLLTGCGGGGSGSSGNSGGGGTSNPLPTISSLSPTSAAAFGPALTLTVTGTGFISSSQVAWAGASLTTTYKSATSLQAQVPASDLTTTGSFNITVSNPSPGGGTSGAVSFSVGSPVPVLNSISPVSAAAGSAALTLTATGTGFESNSVIDWNGAPLSTTYVSATQLTAQVPASDLTGNSSTTTVSVTVSTPAPDGGTSSAQQFSILAPSTMLTSTGLTVNALVWDGTHGKFYASLPSTDTVANSLVAIDPVTGTVGNPQPAGPEPGALALSSDNSFLYVGIDGTGQIERFNLPGLTQDTSLNLTLPNLPQDGQQLAKTIAVAPGMPHTFAAILGNYEPGDTSGGTWVYDDSTARGTSLSNTKLRYSALEWGADASTLYATNSDSSAQELSELTASAAGLSLSKTYADLVPGGSLGMHYDAASGYLYTDGGSVVNPATGAVIGTFNLAAFYYGTATVCALDLQNQRVFFIGQTFPQNIDLSGVTIAAFDSKTYQLLGIMPIAGPKGVPADLMRWGNAGLAFRMAPGYDVSSGGPGQVYLVDGEFVNPALPADSSTGTAISPIPVLTTINPQSAAAGSANVTLTVTGANFDANSAVTWNGTALQTTVTSTTQLQTTIPASDLTAAGTGLVTIAESNSTSRAANTTLAFTILPAAGGTTHLAAWNYAVRDVAWNASNSTLVVPVASADPVYPNTVLEIDPTTGSVMQSSLVPSDPQLVRVTDDGKHVYLGFATVNTVNELSLPDLSQEMSWSLGNDSLEGPLVAGDIEPEPGEAQTTAVTFEFTDVDPRQSNGMTIFDSGIARSNTAYDEIRFKNAQWNSAASTLYGVSIDSGLYSYSVSSSGLTLLSNKIDEALNNGAGSIHFDAGTGYLYGDDGEVIDPSSLTAIGNFAASGMALPDSSLNRVFFLGQTTTQTNTNDYTIQSFDKTTFKLVDSTTLHALVGVPVGFVRWGSNGLAVASSYASGAAGGMLYVLSDSTLVSNGTPSVKPKEERVHAFASRAEVLRGAAARTSR